MRNISLTILISIAVSLWGCDSEDSAEQQDSDDPQLSGGTGGHSGNGSTDQDSSAPLVSGSGGGDSPVVDASVKSDSDSDSDSDTVNPISSIQEIRSEANYQQNPDVPKTDLEQLALDNRHFALDMYQKFAEEFDVENLFFSPYSISSALAMTYAGADTDTETAMAETMHFTLPDQKLHPTMNQESILLNSRGEGAQGADGEPFRLRVVNSIWGQEGYRFVDSFLDTIAINYGAGLRLLDFAKAPDESRIVINTWVEGQTEDRIKDLLPPGSIDSSVVMVLVNAVYFNAGWASKFLKESTAGGDFTDLSGATVTAQMMHQSERFAYYKGNGYQAVELLYDGDQTSMVLLVPDAEKFAQFEQGLTVDTLSEATSSLELKSVQLSMPKWEFETNTIAMKKMFEALGMGIAFTPAADFSGMAEDGGPYIDNIYHKAFVAVDESGTEAAAATAVVMVETAAPMDDVVLVIDRPFIYYIRDIETDTIVFMGRLANPS